MKRRLLAALCIALLLLASACPAASAASAHAARISVKIDATGSVAEERYVVLLRADDSACPMPSGSLDGVYELGVNGTGTAAFPDITFDRMGVFSYTIVQKPGSQALEYDDAVYRLTVFVTKGTGSETDLSVMMTADGEGDKVEVCAFTNVYAVTAHNPPVRKIVTGDTPASAATFSFTLKGVSNTAGLSEMPMPEGAAAGVKTISTLAGTEKEFGELEFRIPGRYVYQVAEINDGQAGYSYDGGVYTLTYTVARNGNALECGLSVAKDGAAVDGSALAFTNVYSGAATPAATAAPLVTAAPTPTPTPTPAPVSGTGTNVVRSYDPTPTPVPTVQIEGRKVWEDDNDVHGVRPAEVTVRLYADGVPVDARATWTVTTGNVWMFTFGEYPAKDANGRAVSYTFQEDRVAYYQTIVRGNTIINTLEGRQPNGYTSISGKKTWKDNDDVLNIRPGTITVHLLRDGEDVAQKRVTAATDWTYTFSNLPKDDGYGHTYSYGIREDGVKGYFAGYNGYDIVNTLLVPKAGETDPDIVAQGTGAPLSPFTELTDEQLEELIDLFDYNTPQWGGLLPTGDETPLYPYIFGGIGAAALVLLAATRRRRRRG